MRYLFLLLTVSSLYSCVSNRTMSRKFSDMYDNVSFHESVFFYSNTPTDYLPKKHLNPKLDTISKNDLMTTSLLWNRLSTFRNQKDSIKKIPSSANISLQLVNNKSIKVSAYGSNTLLDSFMIPIKKKKNYLVLNDKKQFIPIPILFFYLNQKKTILAILKNGHLGFSSYDNETLWILFMGASTDNLFTYEYTPTQSVGVLEKDVGHE